MTLTFPVPYRASADRRRFNRWQSRAEQQKVLCTLNTTYDRMFGLGGQLPQLRDAIRNRGERIPGRSPAESLEMVEQELAVTADAIKTMMREERAAAVRSSGVAALYILVSAALIYTLFNSGRVVDLIVQLSGGLI